MTVFIYHRRRRLQGVISLFELALGSWSSEHRRQDLPTAPRIRRDMGLPALDDTPVIYTPSGTKV